jgi:hypothetical protein
VPGSPQSGFMIMVLRMILRAGGPCIAPSAMQADMGCIDIVHLGGIVQLTTHECVGDRRAMCALDMTKTSTQDSLGRSALEERYTRRRIITMEARLRSHYKTSLPLVPQCT